MGGRPSEFCPTHALFLTFSFRMFTQCETPATGNRRGYHDPKREESEHCFNVRWMWTGAFSFLFSLALGLSPGPRRPRSQGSHRQTAALRAIGRRIDADTGVFAIITSRTGCDGRAIDAGNRALQWWRVFPLSRSA